MSLDKTWLNVDELAEYLSCSKSLIYSKTSRGELPYTKRLGLLFNRQLIDEWLLKDSYHPQDVENFIDNNPIGEK